MTPRKRRRRSPFEFLAGIPPGLEDGTLRMEKKEKRRDEEHRLRIEEKIRYHGIELILTVHPPLHRLVLLQLVLIPLPLNRLSVWLV